MPDTTAVLAAFRAELVAAGLVRRPSEAGAQSSAGGPPPMHVSPIDGPVGPGDKYDPRDPGTSIEDDQTLVLSLLDAGEVDLGRQAAASVSRRVVDVRFRASSTEARRRGFAIAAAITTRLVRPETNYGVGFILGSGGSVIVCTETAPAGGGPVFSSRETGFDDLAKYVVESSR